MDRGINVLGMNIWFHRLRCSCSLFCSRTKQLSVADHKTACQGGRNPFTMGMRFGSTSDSGFNGRLAWFQRKGWVVIGRRHVD
jgi:hypothetical protein